MANVEVHSEDVTALQTATLADRWRVAAASASQYGIVVAFVALAVVLSFSSSAFLTETNLMNILSQWAPVGIIACGMTIVIVAGGFDLSVGAIFTLAAIIAAKVTNADGLALGILAGLGMGLGLGLINGLVVTLLRVNSFIATLATGLMFAGFATVITSGQLIAVTDPSFGKISTNELLGVKIVIWLFLLVAVLCTIALTRTTFGRHVFSVGGNAIVARLSGVRVNVVRLMTFVISGFLAALAGIIGASRVSTAQPDAGTGLELTAIAAVVIGGTSIAGGEGAIWRSVMGVLILAMIGNGFNLLNVEPFYQSIVQGGIIVLAIALDSWGRSRRA